MLGMRLHLGKAAFYQPAFTYPERGVAWRRYQADGWAEEDGGPLAGASSSTRPCRPKGIRRRLRHSPRPALRPSQSPTRRRNRETASYQFLRPVPMGRGCGRAGEDGREGGCRSSWEPAPDASEGDGHGGVERRRGGRIGKLTGRGEAPVARI